MRNTAFVLLIATALCASAPAMADSSPSPTMPAQTSYADIQPTSITNPPDGDNTEVCNYQRETGSLFTTRVCRTLRAWKLMQSEAREFMDFGLRGAHQAGEGG